MENDRKKKEIRWDLVLFVIGGILLAVYGMFTYQTMQDKKDYEQALTRYEELKEYTPITEVEESANTEKRQSVSYEKMFEANEDMIGLLQIPGTEVEYPVMQTMKDEEYYLYRNFFKEDDRNGCLILDTDSDLQKSSNNLIIHGHNMGSGAMFGNLQKYEDETYAKEHSKILLYTREECREYEILAVFRSKVYSVEDKVFKYYHFFEATTQEEFNDFYENVMQLRQFDTVITAEFGDEFITLSTCVYHTTNGRLVVIGKRIN